MESTIITIYARRVLDEALEVVDKLDPDLAAAVRKSCSNLQTAHAEPGMTVPSTAALSRVATAKPGGVCGQPYAHGTCDGILRADGVCEKCRRRAYAKPKTGPRKQCRLCGSTLRTDKRSGQCSNDKKCRERAAAKKA